MAPRYSIRHCRNQGEAFFIPVAFLQHKSSWLRIGHWGVTVHVTGSLTHSHTVRAGQYRLTEIFSTIKGLIFCSSNSCLSLMAFREDLNCHLDYQLSFIILTLVIFFLGGAKNFSLQEKSCLGNSVTNSCSCGNSTQHKKKKSY